MLDIIVEKHKQPRTWRMIGVYFVIFITIYTLLDYLNGGYPAMIKDFGLFLPIINILLNVIMSLISALMLSFSGSFMQLSGKEGKGSSTSYISLIFGLLTYGCTPCVIAFFSVIGITFSVAILPFAGLPYKLGSLFILILGSIWLLHEIRHPKCKVKVQKNVE